MPNWAKRLGTGIASESQANNANKLVGEATLSAIDCDRPRDTDDTRTNCSLTTAARTVYNLV